jgi:hypothetical protein
MAEKFAAQQHVMPVTRISHLDMGIVVQGDIGQVLQKHRGGCATDD